MISRIEIDAIHIELTDELKKYVTRKLGNVERYIPRYARESAHIEVKLRDDKSRDKKRCTCEAIVHLPNENLAAKESTINMFAAVDIVEQKLKGQLKKYKAAHATPRAGRAGNKVRALLGKIQARRRR